MPNTPRIIGTSRGIGQAIATLLKPPRQTADYRGCYTHLDELVINVGIYLGYDVKETTKLAAEKRE